MALRAYTDGIGESAGDSLAINPSLAMSGYVWYVHNGTGVDAASPAGRERKRPLATLAQALTNAADFDIICLMDGHTEVRTSALALTKKVAIVGGGLADGRPTVKLQINAANQSLFTTGASLIWLRNIWFQAAAQSTTAATIQCLSAGLRIKGCYMELSANNIGGGLELAGGWDGVYVENTTFISTAVSPASVPGPAISDTGSGDILRMRSVTFDGGVAGFLNGLAVNLDVVANHLHAEDVRLLNGADVECGQNVGGWMQVSQKTGGARVRWIDSVGGG